MVKKMAHCVWEVPQQLYLHMNEVVQVAGGQTRHLMRLIVLGVEDKGMGEKERRK